MASSWSPAICVVAVTLINPKNPEYTLIKYNSHNRLHKLPSLYHANSTVACSGVLIRPGRDPVKRLVSSPGSVSPVRRLDGVYVDSHGEVIRLTRAITISVIR